MSEIKTTTEQQPHVDVYQKVENIFLKNKNIIIGIFVVIILGIGSFFGYRELYLKPKETQANNKISFAQANFNKDSLQIALNGDGINPGFLNIADDYGMTKAGNLAKYYCGVCYLKAKDFDNAIKYFEDFKPATDELAGLAYMQLGHAYAEKNDFAKAVSNYKRAGQESHSDIYSPYYYKLAGDLLVVQNDFKGAKEMYEVIKKEYPLSEEGQNIDKDIAYAETKLGE